MVNIIKLIISSRAQPIVGLILVLSLPLALAAENIGTVLMVKGPVVAQQAGGSPRTLLIGDDIQQGDVLSTDASSFVVVGFSDGAKITVRPDTTFSVDTYITSSTVFDMTKGGVRALTGKFTKDMPEGYRLQTPIATLGVRGTEYDARLCEGGDCQREEKEIHGDKRAAKEDCEFEDLPDGLYVTGYEGIVAIIHGDSDIPVKVGETVYVDLDGNMEALPCAPKFLYHDFAPSPINFSKIQSRSSASGGAVGSPSGGVVDDTDAPLPPPEPMTPQPTTAPITEPATPDMVEEPEPQASPN